MKESWMPRSRNDEVYICIAATPPAFQHLHPNDRWTFFMEVFADLRGDLAVGHLIGGFNGDDVSPELVSLQTLLQFAFGLPRTKQQNGFSTANRRNNLVIIIVQFARKVPLTAVISLHLLRFIVPRRPDAAKTARLFLDVGADLQRFFPFS